MILLPRCGSARGTAGAGTPARSSMVGFQQFFGARLAPPTTQFARSAPARCPDSGSNRVLVMNRHHATAMMRSPAKIVISSAARHPRRSSPAGAFVDAFDRQRHPHSPSVAGDLRFAGPAGCCRLSIVMKLALTAEPRGVERQQTSRPFARWLTNSGSQCRKRSRGSRNADQQRGGWEIT